LVALQTFVKKICLTWEGQLQYDTNVLPYLLLVAFQGDVAQVAEMLVSKDVLSGDVCGSARTMPGVSGTQSDVTSSCNDCEGGQQCLRLHSQNTLQHVRFFTCLVF
jgi:hypothetical protein